MSHHAWVVITFRVVENHDKISFLRFAFHSDTVIMGRNSEPPIAMASGIMGAKKIPGCGNSKIRRKDTNRTTLESDQASIQGVAAVIGS